MLLFAFIICCTITTFSQAPNSFKYQAVARDANAQVMMNQVVGLRFSLVEDMMTGNVVYAEVHYPTTSDRGVFSLEVGNGNQQTGSMMNVDWANHNYFLRVEMDPQAGNAFQLMGISQLLSVPYAMHAATVEDKDDADADPNNELQVIAFDQITNTLTLSDGGQVDLSSLAGGSGGTDDQTLLLNGTSLTIEDGNSVDLSVVQDGVTDADANPTNEIQNLSFNPNTNQLTISDGNTITIPSGGTDADADPTNELQSISKFGNTVTLSNNGGTFIDEVNDGDANPSNELQNLSFNTNTNQLTISNGNTITIPSGGTDADADPSNEIQTLSQNGLNVSLSNNGGTINVADNDNDNSNELQNLSFDTNTNQLTISNGNTITIPSGGTDADPDPSNELQNLGLSGTQISISDGNTIDLAPILPPDGTDDQTLNLNGTSLSIENGNAIDLSVIQDGVNDADADATNELQSLSFDTNTNQLTISDGNSITIPSGGTDADPDPMNELQTLNQNGLMVTLSNNGGTINVADADNDTTNELQNLSLAGTEVMISNGNTIDLAPILPPGGTDDQTLNLNGTSLSIEDGNAIDLSVVQDGVNDADADPNNELQNLSLVGTEVMISNGNTIDLAPILPPGGTDDQTLNLNGTSLSIEDGNAIDLSVVQDGVTDADADPNNELQFLSLNGTNLNIDFGNSVDLSVIQDGVDDADADPNNEIQTISKSGSTVNLSNGGGSFTDAVDDADADPNNEIQNLSLSGNDLSIANGNTLSLTGIGGQWSTNPLGIHYTGGHIGFGTDNPLHAYQFNDDVFINSGLADFSIGSPNAAHWLFGTINGGADLLMFSGTDENSLSSKVTFKQDGRVGFGTENPLADIHIAGDYEVMRLDGIEPLIGFYDQGNYEAYIRKSVSPDFGLELGTPVGSNKGIEFTRGGLTEMVLWYGNLGIGQNSPTNSLVIGDNWSVGYGFPAVTIGDDLGGLILVGEANNGILIGEFASGDHSTISGSLTKPMRLESNGLSIGDVGQTSNPGSYPLKVFQSSNFGINLENSSADIDWELYVASTGHLELYKDTAFKGRFSGVDGAYTQASDGRLKKDISPLALTLPSLLKLKPSSYKYIDNKASDSRSIGMIAQDVQKLFPELVNEVVSDRTGETLLSVNYAGFGVLAVKAIQEQQETIDEQAQKIEDLETRMARLEALIAEKN